MFLSDISLVFLRTSGVLYFSLYQADSTRPKKESVRRSVLERSGKCDTNADLTSSKLLVPSLTNIVSQKDPMHILDVGPIFLSISTRVGSAGNFLPDRTFSLMPFSGSARRTTRMTFPLSFLCTMTRCSCLSLFLDCLSSNFFLPSVFVCTGSPSTSNFLRMPGSNSACAALSAVKSTEVKRGFTIVSPGYAPVRSFLSSFPVFSLYQL
mmetsp:Transcript_24413/g.47419  ORF Transcript_24413/g.47419 Transcript_24413/m.47419 type:complete len:209 (-) Transcript_24413:865-1491(-)